MPMLMGRPNCSITVKGSWWRPTISMPNIRSDGARKTGAAIATVTIAASVETATTSATRGRNVHHRRNNQQRTDHRPAADIAHVRGQARRGGQDMQGQQTCRLRELEHCEPDEEAPPADRDEGRDPEREIKADLERGEKRDRSL